MHQTWSKRTRKPTGGGRRKLEDMTRPELEAKLDEAFSKAIRLTYSGNGYAACATCGVRRPWKELDCGHYIGRAFRGARWDPKNVAPQCRRCNSHMGGRQHDMRAHLVERYGAEEIERMEARARIQGEQRMDKAWLLEQIELWRGKLATLKANE